MDWRKRFDQDSPAPIAKDDSERCQSQYEDLRCELKAGHDTEDRYGAHPFHVVGGRGWMISWKDFRLFLPEVESRAGSA